MSWIFIYYPRKKHVLWSNKRTGSKSYIFRTPIPWSVNSFLQYQSATSCNVYLKWYILHNSKGVLCHEHKQKEKNIWFLGSTISIFYWQRYFLFVKNNAERNGCVITHWEVLRSLEAFSCTYYVTISCCHFGVRRVYLCSVNNDAIILREVKYWIYHSFMNLVPLIIISKTFFSRFTHTMGRFFHGEGAGLPVWYLHIIFENPPKPI